MVLRKIDFPTKTSSEIKKQHSSVENKFVFCGINFVPKIHPQLKLIFSMRIDTFSLQASHRRPREDGGGQACGLLQRREGGGVGLRGDDRIRGIRAARQASAQKNDLINLFDQFKKE